MLLSLCALRRVMLERLPAWPKGRGSSPRAEIGVLLRSANWYLLLTLEKYNGVQMLSCPAPI